MNSRSNLVLLAIAIIVCVSMAESFAADAVDLKPSLRDDAYVTVYTPTLKGLLDHVEQLVPQAKMLSMQAVTWMSQMGLPKDETMAAPVAFMWFATEEGEEPHVVLLFGMKTGDWLKAMGEANADGIFARDGSSLMAVPDAVAFAPDNDSLIAYKKLTAVASPYKPTANAAKLLAKADLFVHVNLPETLAKYETDIMEAVARMLESMGNMPGQAMMVSKMYGSMFLQLLNLADEVDSVDVALQFDQEGLKITGLTSVGEKGELTGYLRALGKPERADIRLPLVEQYSIAMWAQWDRKLFDALLADGAFLADWLAGMAKDQPGNEAALAAMKDAMKAQGQMLGSQFAQVVKMSPDGMAMSQIVEVQNLDEARKLTAQTVNAYNQIIQMLLKAEGGDAPMNIDYTYQADAKTIAGEKVDVMKTTITAANADMQAQLDKVMAMYGPNGMDTLIGGTGKHMAVSMSDEMMEKTLSLLKGQQMELLNDGLLVKKMRGKLSPGQNVVAMLVPARFAEFAGGMMAKMTGRNASDPIPFATPVSAGLKAVDPRTASVEAYVPQACITECTTVVMTMMGGGTAPPAVEE